MSYLALYSKVVYKDHDIKHPRLDAWAYVIITAVVSGFTIWAVWAQLQ